MATRNLQSQSGRKHDSVFRIWIKANRRVSDSLRSRESKRGYSQAFGIDLPKPSATITKGISDRHDIVHRTGKSPNGVMGSWDMAQVLVLKDDVAQYAT
jgi:hypothetical protein